MNLTKIRNLRLIFVIIITILSAILVILVISNLQKAKIETVKDFKPPSEQPVKEGKFDESAPISQSAKNELSKIKNKLPFRHTFTTSTSTKVIFSIYMLPKDEFTLVVESPAINFQSTYDDPMLAKNVLDFRETATYIYNWLKDNGVDTSKVFISWGSKAYMQQSAEKWLNESPQFPKVIKSDNQYIFQPEPVK